MGLSGRKVKQRIGADPRNLSWADDAARFGSNYLSKFGWDASKGLGAGGDGMKSHIKVSHKLDMLGIGAAQTKDPNGIAWKQNRDFENLLRRLNENLPAEEGTSAEVEDKPQDNAAEGHSDAGAGEKKKKRKHRENADEDRSERKKKKESKDKSVAEDTALVAQIDSVKLDNVETTTVAVQVQKVVTLPRHRAHRARAIAAKNIASKSSAHISEILGVAPDSQAVVVESAPKGKLTSVTETDALGMDKLTTSTKSLADYFKDKLQARMGSSSGSSTPTSTVSVKVDEDEEERPRMGIGASRMHLEIQTETRIEEETQRVGLSKFSSLMSSSFLAATSSITTYVPPQAEQNEAVAHISDSDSESESDSETKKQSKKDKKKKVRKTKGISDEEEEKGTKSKKDKDKGKAVEEEEEAVADSDEEKRRKKEKKEKKKKAAEDVKMDTTEDGLDKAARKEAKRKRKAEKLEAKAQASQATSISKKEKKRRTDS